MSKSIVVYFSASKAGNTQRLAETIAKATGADLFAIEPVTPYTQEDLDWTIPGCRSVEEMRQPGCRPPIKNVGPDLAEVETVYLGFPIWCWIAPTIVNTWLEAVDLTGKTVIPFATSGGSAYRKSNDSLVASAPGATFRPGRVLPPDAGEEQIQEWLSSLAETL